jgi:hypothetical protein
MEQELMNFRELAKYLGVTTQTLRRRKAADTFDIPEVNMGGRPQYSKTDVDEHILKNKDDGNA